MIKYIFVFFSVILIGCNTATKENYTFFGGKIINPKSKYVSLYNADGIIDSIALKEDNTFIGKLKNIKEGLYYFQHGEEFQYLFLEPNDSLLIRLNTWDFDESLVFSGVNANRNNALIDAYLQNENDNKKIRQFFKLNYGDFKQKIDSVENVKQLFLKNYTSQNEENSEIFLDILKMATLYPVYTNTESYSIYKHQQKEATTFNNDSIYNYRKNINTNIENLTFFSPILNLVYSQIYNDTYRTGLKDNSDEFNSELLKNIDRKIETKKLRNNILKQTVITHFYQKPYCINDDKTINTYFSLTTNKEDKEEVSLLLKDAESLNKNDKLPNFSIINNNGNIKNSIAITKKKNTVLYFVNQNHSPDNWVGNRINSLLKKYPKIKFYVININNNAKNKIKNLDLKHQYYIKKDCKAHNFLKSKFSRVVLVNKNGLVNNCFSGLSSEKLENQIAELEKK